MATLVGAGKKHGEVNYTWTATLDYNVVDKDNPIIAGMPMEIYDEAFFKLNFAPEVHPILTVTMPDTPDARKGGGVGQTIPQMWTYEHTLAGGQPARAFVWMQGHMVDSLEETPAITQGADARHRLGGQASDGRADRLCGTAGARVAASAPVGGRAIDTALADGYAGRDVDSGSEDAKHP